MSKCKFVIRVRVLQSIVGIILCMALYSTPVHAVWDYSLAAQIAMHDGMLATCGKIEPRLNAALGVHWSKHVRLHGIKAILSARKSAEYSEIYQDILFEHIISSWGDSEKQAHDCEKIYMNLRHEKINSHQWWQDRLCVDLPLNSEKGPEDGQRCGAGPGAEVSFESRMSDTEISILRIAPSSDVSFPRAGSFVPQNEPGYRVGTSHGNGVLWAIPESIDFEWKEWPRTVPDELKNKRDLESARLYVDGVRSKVQRKREKVAVRSRIPPEVLTEVLQMEQAAKLGHSVTGSVKLFFIFMPDGLRFRWEEWSGKCIKNYGGDDIGLPRDKLLSGDWICGEPEPKDCRCPGIALLTPALEPPRISWRLGSVGQAGSI